MPFSISKFFLAIVVGVVVGFLVWIVGVAFTQVPPVVWLGATLKAVSFVAGILAAIWYYFAGTNRIA